MHAELRMLVERMTLCTAASLKLTHSSALQPILPAYLLDAERALHELGPGTSWRSLQLRPSAFPERLVVYTGGVAAAGVLSDGVPLGNQLAPAQLEEYFRRAAVVSTQGQPVSEQLPAASTAVAGSQNQFAAVLSADSGAVALKSDVDAALVASSGPAGESQLVPVLPAQPNVTFEDDAAQEMIDAYAASGRAHVNPVTGAPVRWGDTWMHHRGGGIGTGRDSRLRRRPEVDALVSSSADRRALLAFYEACNGPRWGVARNWGVGEPCANAWHGVRCVGGRVVELMLHLNNVACMGGLTLAHLANVSELVTLDLSDNHMSGALPGQDMHLTPRLQSLVLSGNDFTGTLPAEISAMKQLRHLDISASSLSGPLPASLGQLTRLEVLYLGEHGVGLQRNALTGPLPSAWRGMTALKRLSLAGNPVGGSLPSWLAALPQLQELTLRDAHLSGSLPAWLAQCRALRVLDLSGNDFSGDIPASWSEATALVHVDLSRNALDGRIPPEWSRMAALRVLRLAHNALEGTLPTSLAELTSLVELDVSHNVLKGDLPSQLASMPQLRVLHANSNRFGGPFPGWLSTAPVLSRLHLDGNRFNGTLDDGFDWAGARGIVELHASGNSLSGTVPAGLGRLRKLASLQLAHNKLSGTLPPELGDAAQMVRLDVSHNALSGTVPHAFGRLLELAELHVSHNRLNGPLPDSLGALPLLRSVLADDNSFSGPLPEWLGTAQSLGVVDVSGNAFTGALHDSWLDGDGGRLNPLPLRRGFVEREERHVIVGANPLLCPLKAWASLVSAHCAWVHLSSVSWTASDVVQLHWSEPDLTGVTGTGCVFTVQKHVQWVPATNNVGHAATCTVPHGASQVKLGHNSTAVSHSLSLIAPPQGTKGEL